MFPYIKIHSYLAHTGISKGGKFILQLFYLSFFYLECILSQPSLFLFSNSHIQPSELPYWLLWTQPATHRCGVWRQWPAAGLQCSADKAPTQFHWHVCGQHKGKWGNLGILFGFSVTLLSRFVACLFLEVCIVPMTLYKSHDTVRSVSGGTCVQTSDS